MRDGKIQMSQIEVDMKHKMYHIDVFKKHFTSHMRWTSGLRLHVDLGALVDFLNRCDRNAPDNPGKTTHCTQ